MSDGKDGGPGKDLLSVTDQRTGRRYELPITDGTIREIGRAHV